MKHARIAGSLAALLLLVTPGAVSGQVTLSGAVGWYFPDLELVPDVNAGPGVDGSLRLHLTEWLHVGGGVQFNAHTVGASSDPYEVLIPFLESRLVLSVGSPRWRAFLAPRAGWVRHSLRISGRDVSGTGRLVGGLVGLGFRVSAALTFEASAAYYHATVEDLDVEGLPIPLDDLSVDAPGLRAAVAWTPW